MEADPSEVSSLSESSPPRRPARASTWIRAYCYVVSAITTLACHSAPERSVAVREPPAPDAPDSGESLGDAGQLDAASPSPHGPVPVWPPSEQTLDLDYGGEPVRAGLVLVPNPSRLDVHFNVDTTASFGNEIDTIQAELTRSIIPRLRSRVTDTQLGVSGFADFAVEPVGRPASAGSPDVPYRLLSPITAGLSQVKSAVNALDRPLGDGGDEPEAAAEALFQIATGAGFELQGHTIIAPFDRARAAAKGGGTLGGVGFRQGAFRVVVHITDAPAHTPDEYAAVGIEATHSLQEAAEALHELGVRVIGICSSGRGNSHYAQVRAELSQLAIATGAHAEASARGCPTGRDGAFVPSFEGLCPWVFDVAFDGSGLADSIPDAVVSLLDKLRFQEVHAEIGEDPLGFIQAIALAPVAQRPGLDAPDSADRLPADAPDGVLDSYLDVSQQHRLGFAVSLQNTRIAASDFEQRFRVSVRLIGDGVLLEERVLGIRVPASTATSVPVADDQDGGVGP